MLNIKERLKRVATFVEGNRLADIGSDHAYLPIYLAKNNKVNFAVSGEVVDGPHKSSIKNVADNNLQEVIFCRKGSGFAVINLDDDINVITICGMGGKLIADILEDGKDKLINRPQLILQPNVASNLVREKLQQLSYKIVAEDILEEDGHIYEIIVAVDGTMSLTDSEINYGLFLPLEKNEVFIEKYHQEVAKIDYILEQLEKSKETNNKKVAELMLKKKELEELLK